MEFARVMRERRSIRSYLPDPIPEATIREIFDRARWTPSWRNTQSWNAWIVSGTTLARFKEQFNAAVQRQTAPDPDLAHSSEWPSACAARAAAQSEARLASLEAVGEPSNSAALLERAANVFGAPCLLVFGFDECLAPAYAAYDTGAFVQSVCLAAHDMGLGTCVTATLVRHPAILRELLPGVAGKRLAVGVALGYPAPGAADNTFTRTRAAVGELVTWAD
jgi:nitroreductase